jgi:hypothetical protein
LFLDGDGHVGYSSIDENRRHFESAGFRIVQEVYHERTFVLGNSVWQKFRQWPGMLGRVGGIGSRLTSGLFRLPNLAILSFVGATIGRAFPRRYARGVTTVAEKI